MNIVEWPGLWFNILRLLMKMNILFLVRCLCLCSPNASDWTHFYFGQSFSQPTNFPGHLSHLWLKYGIYFLTILFLKLPLRDLKLKLTNSFRYANFEYFLPLPPFHIHVRSSGGLCLSLYQSLIFPCLPFMDSHNNNNDTHLIFSSSHTWYM